MGKDKKVETLFYFDGILKSNETPEELEEKIKRLTEESKKLTDWIEM